MATAFEVKPFAFDRLFTADVSGGDGGAHGADAHALRAEIERLKREQEAAIAVARAEAFQQGLDQGRAEREAAVLAATDALHASIEGFDSRMVHIEDQATREAAELALAAADLIAGHALALDPACGVDAAVGRALRQVKRGEPIIVRVNPDLVADLEKIIAVRQGRDRRRLSLTVIADDSLAVGDAQISWEQGGMSLDADARRAIVREELLALFPDL